MKKKLSTIFLIILLIVGISLLLYPTIGEIWNKVNMSRVNAIYGETIEQFSEEEIESFRQKAINYNKTLVNNPNRFHFSEEDKEIYNSLLNIGGNGVMGIVDIPVIDTRLPVYHGTSEGVLQVAVGHLEGSSLPVGGESTHTIITSHTGLPSAKLFTRVDQLKIGDIFFIRVLGDNLAYKVDQINTVLPDNYEFLQIEMGQDLATLITCTPYGVNTHRLLVRGLRIDYNEKLEPIVVAKDSNMVWILSAVIVFLVLIIIVLIKRNRKLKIKNKK